MNIYEKILGIMTEVQKLQKDGKVDFANTHYKALTEEKVTTIMREKLLKYKLVVFPVEQNWSRQGNISHVDVMYKMVNVENPEEWIPIASCGDGADTQDKGSGKAMTYAYKYMWLRTFALPTGEDPDKISSEELDAKEKEEKEEKAKVEKITDGQILTITELCKDIGLEIPENLNKWSKSRADSAIAKLMEKKKNND